MTNISPSQNNAISWSLATFMTKSTFHDQPAVAHAIVNFLGREIENSFYHDPLVTKKCCDQQYILRPTNGWSWIVNFVIVKFKISQILNSWPMAVGHLTNCHRVIKLFFKNLSHKTQIWLLLVMKLISDILQTYKCFHENSMNNFLLSVLWPIYQVYSWSTWNEITITVGHDSWYENSWWKLQNSINGCYMYKMFCFVNHNCEL